eukprot:TRINITY_DN6808_c0_g1_i1.p1 TRINITY_DN6808_c0_g1~~TRINITY_DN6808_c0_g1_i1.p1  ORF type:complete len:166 (-),score=21.10 TRINITY_DN6808_c0_g1_i1:31-528(-)
MKFLLLAALVAYAAADCKPPSTDLHIESCQDGTVITVDPSTVKMDPYPANPKVPVSLSYTFDNTGSKTYDKLYIDVKLSYYGELLFKCGWHSIPIPINNLDGCKIGGNCPIKPGIIPTNVKIDLTPFATIIEKLASNTYYRLDIKTKDSDKTTVLNCLQADFLLQ